MVKLSFSFDGECTDVKETHAIYLIDGLLQIHDGNNLFVKEEGLPLIEFALWLSKWLADDLSDPNKVFSFYPDSMESEIFKLARIGSSQYCLSYYEERGTSLLKADYTDFQIAFTQFIVELSRALKGRYNLQLENILFRVGKA